MFYHLKNYEFTKYLCFIHMYRFNIYLFILLSLNLNTQFHEIFMLFSVQLHQYLCVFLYKTCRPFIFASKTCRKYAFYIGVVIHVFSKMTCLSFTFTRRRCHFVIFKTYAEQNWCYLILWRNKMCTSCV